VQLLRGVQHACLIQKWNFRGSRWVCFLSQKAPERHCCRVHTVKTACAFCSESFQKRKRKRSKNGFRTHLNFATSVLESGECGPLPSLPRPPKYLIVLGGARSPPTEARLHTPSLRATPSCKHMHASQCAPECALPWGSLSGVG
jgi:hypothetical protein